MPFNWIISINPNTTGVPTVKFDPNPLQQVGTGDEVVWANNDGQAHWPGLCDQQGKITNPTYFMPTQIAPHSTSTTFAAGGSGTLNYACSLHPDETGTIQVVAVG